MTEMTAPQQPLFNLEKLYVKDLSLEVPHAPAVFLERDPPRIDLQLNNHSDPLGEGRFEITLTAIVTAKLNDKVVFLIEAKQAGIFHILNIPQEEMEPVLSVVCPNMLYPYLRETISDASMRAGFVPVMLSPLNFEALYVQQKQQQVPVAPAVTH